MLTSLVVAAGSSRRMGFDKTFALLDGKPVVAHTVRAFEQAPCVHQIVLLGRDDRLSELEALVEREQFRKVTAVIAGGRERQDSVWAGLRRIDAGAEFVAVQDAARPLVRPELIERVLAAARESGGAACAAPVTDTLKRGGADHAVVGSVERENLFAMQTPQIFRRELLMRAYEAVRAAGLAITDEVSALEFIGQKVVLVPHDDWNFKITFPRDLALAEMVVRARRSTREAA